MAKDSVKNNMGEDNVGTKILSGVIVFLIIIVWLGIFAAFVKFDVGNFGSQVLGPVLKDVPIINVILPKMDEEEATGSTEEGGESKVATMSQALDKIKELEAQLAAYQQSTKDLTEKNDELTAEIDRLKMFEENQVQFKNDKDAFYQEIVYGNNAPNVDTYINWYSKIDPASAADIYRQIVSNGQYDEDVKQLAKTYAEMKPANAAKILETMAMDLDTVTKILLAMKSDQRAAIMENMDANYAANITKKMTP